MVRISSAPCIFFFVFFKINSMAEKKEKKHYFYHKLDELKKCIDNMGNGIKMNYFID